MRSSISTCRPSPQAIRAAATGREQPTAPVGTSGSKATPQPAFAERDLAEDAPWAGPGSGWQWSRRSEGPSAANDLGLHHILISDGAGNPSLRPASRQFPGTLGASEIASEFASPELQVISEHSQHILGGRTSQANLPVPPLCLIITPPHGRLDKSPIPAACRRQPRTTQYCDVPTADTTPEKKDMPGSSQHSNVLSVGWAASR